MPVPSRDESRTEYERAETWKKIFANKFNTFYRDWLPNEITVEEAIDTLKIPYIPYWSFGERLPVIRESSPEPGSISGSYEVLARLLVKRLDWVSALKEVSLPPVPRRSTHSLDQQWLDTVRHQARAGRKTASRRSYMEVVHYCVDSPIERPQDQLLEAAREAQLHTTGWPFGVVLDRVDGAPKPRADGIVAEIQSSFASSAKDFDYWYLRKNGDFYILVSLHEQDAEPDAVALQTRVYQTTEALQHCARLYRKLGADVRATVTFTMAYGGLRETRLLDIQARSGYDAFGAAVEDHVSTTIKFQISQVESELASLVEQLCAPLFVLFDFYKLPPKTYATLISRFTSGRISNIFGQTPGCSGDDVPDVPGTVTIITELVHEERSR